MTPDDDRVPVEAGDRWPDDTDEDEGVVVNWFVSEGAHVAVDDPLCEFQVEKVSVDALAPVDGIVDEIVLDEDEEFVEGATLAWIRPD